MSRFLFLQTQRAVATAEHLIRNKLFAAQPQVLFLSFKQ